MVEHYASRSQMFGEANRLASQRSAMSRLARQARNHPAKIRLRGYHLADTLMEALLMRSPVSSLPMPKLAEPAKPRPRRRITRQQCQQLRQAIALLQKMAAAKARRVVKPRPLAPLHDMAFAGNRQLACKRDAYRFPV